MGCVSGLLFANKGSDRGGSSDIKGEIVTDAPLENSKLLNSFAVMTLPRQKPNLPYFVSQIMQTRAQRTWSLGSMKEIIPWTRWGRSLFQGS